MRLALFISSASIIEGKPLFTFGNAAATTGAQATTETQAPGAPTTIETNAGSGNGQKPMFSFGSGAKSTTAAPISTDNIESSESQVTSGNGEKPMFSFGSGAKSTTGAPVSTDKIESSESQVTSG